MQNRAGEACGTRFGRLHFLLGEQGGLGWGWGQAAWSTCSGAPPHSLTEEVAHSGQLHIDARSGDMVIQSSGSGARQTRVGIPAPPSLAEGPLDKS